VSDFIPVEIKDLPADTPVPEWADALNENLKSLASGVNRIGGTIVAAHGAITTIRDAIEPLVETLSRNPMFRMLGVGKP
jgi:hypothetical protein